MMKPNKTLVALAALSLLGGCGVFKGSGKPKTAVLGERVAILSSETGIEIEPSLADVAVILPTAAANDSWTQPGGNASKSMGHPALGASIGTAWTGKVAGATKETRLAASPVIADGKLFVMDTGARITAFDAKNGARLWSVQFGDGGKTNSSALFGGGVSVEGAFLYATNGLGDVGALNVADGAVVWKKRPGGPLRGAPTIALGLVYAMSQDNQMFALNATDGAVQWNEAAAVQLSGVFGVAAPAVAQGTVVAGFSSGDLNAYRYENGRTVWQEALSRTSITTSVATLSDIDADPVIDQGRVFAIGQGGRMVSLELVTGQRLWELNIAGIATPWVAGEWVFVVTDEAKLLCVARATGKIRWVSQLQRYRKAKSKNGPIAWSGPVLAGERLFVASSEGQMVAVNPGDGKVQTTTKIGAPVYLSPVVANSTLYVLDNSGKITAFR
jgi:outer membrane protein assembly factor BamB